jgi:hypothetical protein
VGVVLAASCGPARKSTFGSGTTGSDAATGTGGTQAMASTGEGFNLTGSGGSGGSENACNTDPNVDDDKDGFSDVQGDCNDCDKNVNPNAVEVLGGGSMGVGGAGGGSGTGGMYAAADENCNGKVDEPPVVCDGKLPIDGTNAFDEAKAIGLCPDPDTMKRPNVGHNAKKEKWPNGGPLKWGVLSADWVSLDQTPPPPNMNYALGHGILTGFGPNVKPQEGKQMLALSSGTARQPTDPDYQSVSGFSKGYTMQNPPGQFPKESKTCQFASTGQAYDGAAVMFKIRTPSNAYGFKFNFNFYSFEWPGYVCSTFNDFFVAMLMPYPKQLVDGNISFDKNGDPVSVNNAFVEVCGCKGGPPCMAGGKTFTCPLGTKTLEGTGFEPNHGSTMWLQTQAPIEPNSDMTIQFAVSDSGDGVLDSTTLVDNWVWIAKPGTSVSTVIVPNPK